MTERAFINGIALLETWFGPQPPKWAIHIRARFFDRVANDADWEVALGRCCDDLRKWPTGSEIRDRLPGQVTLDTEAQGAWMRVLARAEGRDGVRMISGPNGPEPSDAGFTETEREAFCAVGGLAAIAMVAWQAQTEKGGAQALGFLVRDFLAAYRSGIEHLRAGLLANGARRELAGAEVRQIADH